MLNNVFVMTKTPLMGVSKTRLSKEIGFVKSKRLTLNNLEKIRKMFLRRKEYDVKWYLTPEATFRSYSFSFVRNIIMQNGKDIGEKIWYLVNRKFCPFILIGSDIPKINYNIISNSFKKLKTSDVLLGPTFDGGFWLIGFSYKKKIPYPFQHIRWSSKHTLKDLIQNLIDLDISYEFTTTLRDIDNSNDYCKNNDI